MIDRTTVVQLAERAGFGANQRNTLLTKLTLFAKYVEDEVRQQPATVADVPKKKPAKTLSQGGLSKGKAD